MWKSHPAAAEVILWAEDALLGMSKDTLIWELQSSLSQASS